MNKPVARDIILTTRCKDILQQAINDLLTTDSRIEENCRKPLSNLLMEVGRKIQRGDFVTALLALPKSHDIAGSGYVKKISDSISIRVAHGKLSGEPLELELSDYQETRDNHNSFFKEHIDPLFEAIAEKAVGQALSPEEATTRDGEGPSATR